METDLCAGAATYLDLLNNHEIQTKLDRLARHKSRIERTFHRSLKELKALQTSGAIRRLTLCDIAETVPPLASPSEIAKRTQAGVSARPFKSIPDTFELEWVTDPEPESASIAAGASMA